MLLNQVTYMVFQQPPVVMASNQGQVLLRAQAPTFEAAMEAVKHLQLTKYAITCSTCIASTIDMPLASPIVTK